MQRRVPPALGAHVPEADTTVPLGACHQHGRQAGAGPGRVGAAASARVGKTPPVAATQPIPFLPISQGWEEGRSPLSPITPSQPYGPAPHMSSQSTKLTVPPDVFFFFSWLKGCVVNSFYTYLLSFSFLWKLQLVSGLSLCLECSQLPGLETVGLLPRKPRSAQLEVGGGAQSVEAA